MSEFFEKNRKKYQWDKPRYKGYVIRCADEKSYKMVKKIIDTADQDVNLVTLINDEFKDSSLTKPKVVKGIWAEGVNANVDKDFFGNEKVLVDKLTILKGQIVKNPESVSDVMGEVKADYQDYLEKEWMDGLRSKYKIEVNQSALKDIR